MRNSNNHPRMPRPPQPFLKLANLKTVHDETRINTAGNQTNTTLRDKKKNVTIISVHEENITKNSKYSFTDSPLCKIGGRLHTAGPSQCCAYRGAWVHPLSSEEKVPK